MIHIHVHLGVKSSYNVTGISVLQSEYSFISANKSIDMIIIESKIMFTFSSVSPSKVDILPRGRERESEEGRKRERNEESVQMTMKHAIIYFVR